MVPLLQTSAQPPCNLDGGKLTWQLRGGDAFFAKAQLKHSPVTMLKNMLKCIE